jgi:dGTPase
MVSDIIASSWDATGETKTLHNHIPVISMSQKLRNTINVLREFMFETVYIPIDQGQKGEAARQVIQLLYDFYSKNSDQIPTEYQGNDRSTLDYIAGMTDQYAIQAAEKIEPGIAKTLERGLV